MGGAIDGMLAEYVVLNQEGVVHLPDHLSYEAGATLPCAAVTAWQALVTRGQLAAGETVLLLDTGGVSMKPSFLANLTPFPLPKLTDRPMFRSPQSETIPVQIL
jgi:NADPH:quinone reductase-like Zn-dependent oxidoreductase